QDARTTPFNIGRRIELADLTDTEAAPLAAGLDDGEGLLSTRNRERAKARKEEDEDADQTVEPGSDSALSPSLSVSGFRPFAVSSEKLEALLKRILYWTGGHPYLTQRVCQAVAGDPSAPTPDSVDRQ